MEFGYFAAVLRTARASAGRSRRGATNSGPCSRRFASFVLIAFALGSASTGCREQEAPPPEPIRPIKILSIGGDTKGVQLEFPGTIEAARHSRMGFEVQGRIIDYPVVEGERLKKGDLIAKLDPRDYQERSTRRRPRPIS